MSRPLRIVLLAGAALVAVVVVVFAIAWFAMPKDWIDQQAQRRVAQMKGASVRWTRLTPAIQWLSIGVKIEGLTVRIPDVAPPTTDLRANEIFVRMKLLPLLSSRVEVASAKLDGAWITLTEQAPTPEAPPGAQRPPQLQIQVPRVDFQNLNVRTRDPLGSGMELKNLSGDVAFEGTLDAPRGIRATAKAESLFWKPSAAAKNVPLPSPLKLEAELAPKGAPGILQVTRGTVGVGPLESAVAGTVTFPKPGATGKDAAIAVDLELVGKPQKVDSGDKAFRGIAASSPATWNGTVSWKIRASGKAPEIVSDGLVQLSGFSVRAKDNAFNLDQVRSVWNTRPDRTFTASGSGGGSGVSITFRANGSLEPGGATQGELTVHAPAARLNGIVPNAPKWTSGTIEARATFSLRPPAKPDVRWNVKGSGLDGTMQGLTHPVRGLAFDAEGNDATANLKSLRAQVASSTIQVSGTVARGKPLSTGTFKVAIDKLVAEEWAPPAGGKAPEKVAAPPPTALPLPIGAFTGSMDIGEARSGGMVARNISTPVNYDGKNLTAAPIKGTIGTGSFEGAFNMNAPFTKPSYSLHMDVKRAPVEQVASGTIPFSSATTGFLSGVVNLSGDGFPSPKPNESLRGLIEGTLEDGKVKLTPAMVAVARALGLNQSSEVPLTKVAHTVRIQGTKMLIDKANGDLGEDKAEMNGWVGLDHALDLNVLLRLAPARVKGSTVLAKLGQYARDSEGRLPVGLKITGLDRAPRITINTEALFRAATKQMTSEAGKKLMNQLVRGLSQRPDSVRKADSTLAVDSTKNLEASSKTTPDSTQQDPLRKAGDALKHIFGK